MTDQQTIYMPGTEQNPNGFPTNTVNKYFIDVDPKVNDSGDIDLNDLTNGKWAWLAGGISGATVSGNETTANDQYYDGDGYGDTDVTAKRDSIAMSGNRKIGDPAQDFIASKQEAIGNSLRTRLIWIRNGQVIVASVTLTNIVSTGGNANAKQTFSVTLNLNGRPRTVNGKLTMTVTPDNEKMYTAAVDTSAKNPMPQGVVVDDASVSAQPTSPTQPTSQPTHSTSASDDKNKQGK